MLVTTLLVMLGFMAPMNDNLVHGDAPSHDAWTVLLQKHVTDDGAVNYKGFKKDEKALDAYLKTLTDNPVQDDWTRQEEMAYLINAYNAFTIKLIVKSYPVKSITDIHRGKAWDVKWIKLGDKMYSLNNIENDILRPKFQNARIHFAVNCAAKSCPPIKNSAWIPETLDRELYLATKAFVNNTKYNSIHGKTLKLSKIFEWYAEDFGDLKGFISKYAAKPINQNAKIEFVEYDWALNR